MGAGKPGVPLDLDFGCQLDTTQLRLFDVGDVVYEPVEDRARDIGERASYVCRQVVALGARPLLLGGDHALACYSIGAMAQRYPKLGVLQFDAHPDLYAVGAPCDEQLNHANAMHWVRRMPHVQALWQVGVRDFFHITSVPEVLKAKVVDELNALPKELWDSAYRHQLVG